MITLDAFAREAEAWLAARVQPRSTGFWGHGSDDVSVFRDLDPDGERALLRRAQRWQATKFDAGYGSLTWPVEYGGRALPIEYERVFHELEAGFEVPEAHETFSVTLHLVAPTVREFGTPWQRDRLVRSLVRTDELCCQLFSEPGAGSDLASLSTRAERDGDDWVVNGQKVWTSGAMHAEWAQLIARTDVGASKHAGMTAFILPMDTPGIEVRPIRQMTGGSSFAEVFLTDVRVPDRYRLGAVGGGWTVALTTLGYERATSGRSNGKVGGTVTEAMALARWAGLSDHPLVRQAVAGAYTDDHTRMVGARRAAAGTAAHEGSIGKLQWTEGMRRLSDTASALLGPRLVAETGEWGTYAWAAHVLGAPGYRIAGGSDEIQRTIIGERVLGLPREPRVAEGEKR